MSTAETEKDAARLAIVLRMPAFLMFHAGVVAVPLALEQHRWQSFVSCVLLCAVGFCTAGMIKGRVAFAWAAVALWFASLGFALIWLWGSDLAWLLLFPGVPVPLDMVVDLLPATRKLAPAAPPAG